MNENKQTGGIGDNGDFDRDFAAASRAYKGAANDLPPPAMDDAIRAAARRAVKSQPHAVGKSWVARWSAPISAAALVVLTVSVGFLAIEERPELAPAPLKDSVKKQGVTVPAASVVAPESAAPAPSPVTRSDAAMAQTPSPPTRAAGNSPPPGDQDAALRDTLSQSANAMVERRRNESTGVSAGQIATQEAGATAARDRQVAAPSPAAAAPPAVAVAKEAKAFVADPPEADKTQATQAASVAGLAESVKREAAEGTRAMPKLDANVAMQATKSLAAPAGPTIASATATSPPVYATPAAPQAMTAKVSESAEAWMKRILELKRLGKVRESDDELVKFRKRYPDFVLPEELKAAK